MSLLNTRKKWRLNSLVLCSSLPFSVHSSKGFQSQELIEPDTAYKFQFVISIILIINYINKLWRICLNVNKRRKKQNSIGYNLHFSAIVFLNTYYLQNHVVPINFILLIMENKYKRPCKIQCPFDCHCVE